MGHSGPRRLALPPLLPPSAATAATTATAATAARRPRLCALIIAPLLHFHLQALKEGQRIDGRAPHELRTARFQFALDDSACTACLGRTRVLAVVSAALGPLPTPGSG